MAKDNANGLKRLVRLNIFMIAFYAVLLYLGTFYDQKQFSQTKIQTDASGF